MSFIAQQSYKIDLTPQGGYVVVYVSQHDNEAREIVFKIHNQGKAFDIPANINVSVQGVKSNSGYFTHNCTYSGNLVTMPIADDMTDVIGKAVCVLKFTNASEEKLATAKFILNVDSDSSSEGIIVDTVAEEIFNQLLDEIRAQAAVFNVNIATLQSMVGTPLIATTAASMTNHNKIYVYTGSETGYTYGDWYYWDDTEWQSGGQYNSVPIIIDQTPTSGSTNTVSSNGVYTALGNKVDKVSGKGLSTEDYTTAEKTKLASFDDKISNIEEGLNSAKNSSVLGKKSKLDWQIDGTGYIDSAGAVHESNINAHTNYVRIDQLDSICYKRQGITSSTPVAYMAFYDVNKDFILSISAKPSQSAIGYLATMESYKIPQGAVYARFTTYINTETYGEFDAYGISAINIIDKYTLYPYGKVIPPTSIIIGETININTGKKGTSAKTARTGTLLTEERCAIRITGSTYKMQALAYGRGASISTGASYLGKLATTWIEDDIVYIPSNVPVVALIFTRTDGEDITNADVTEIISSIICYVPYDINLFRSINNIVFTSTDEIALMPTSAEVISVYDELVEMYPGYISKNALTVNGFTNYEYVMTIGNYNPQTAYRSPDSIITKPKVLITSGIHGYERSSVMSLYAFVKAMCENDYALSDIIDIAQYRIIPIINPWAYDNDTRLNENSVDLNCNFDTSTWEETAQGDNYSGASPASEVETQWMQSWIDNNTDAVFLIDWHNSSKVKEISCLLGLNGQTEKGIKKKYLLGINKVIPYWQRKRGLATDNIYAYTGNTITKATLKNYCIEKDILVFTMETSWNVKNTGKHSNITIGTGCEVIGNLLIGLKSYLEEMTIV